MPPLPQPYVDCFARAELLSRLDKTRAIAPPKILNSALQMFSSTMRMRQNNGPGSVSLTSNQSFKEAIAWEQYRSEQHHFVEVQFQKNERLYGWLFVEIFLFLRYHPEAVHSRAVVIDAKQGDSERALRLSISVKQPIGSPYLSFVCQMTKSDRLSRGI